jgi:hypothetical protein
MPPAARRATAGSNAALAAAAHGASGGAANRATRQYGYPSRLCRGALALLGLALGTALGGCTFDYGAGAGPEQLADEIPETILTAVTHTVVRDGRVVAEIQAQRVENFPATGRAVLSGVRYAEFDGDGAMAASGKEE